MGDEVAQLVFALPQGALVLVDASPSLALHVLAVPALTWSALAGVCIDGLHEQVVLLDAAGPNLLRIDLADLRAGTSHFHSTSLPPAWSTIRGIAFDVAHDRIVGFDPETGDLLQHSDVDPNPRAALLRPVPGLLWFGFAPTGSGYQDLFLSSGDQRLLTSEWTWHAVGIDVDTATLRATVATSAWSPHSPDPSGITYDSVRDVLIVSDGEVDEMSIYAGANVWECSRTGVVSRHTTTVAYTHEPCGIGYQEATRTFYMSDDDQRRIWVVATGPDGLLNTADDTRRSFSVNNFNTDCEEVAYDAARNELWIGGGALNAVYRLRPGPNGIFDGTSPNGDDQLLTVHVSSFGLTDVEAVTVRASDGGVYVMGVPKTLLVHLDSSGQLVRTINLPSTGIRVPSGIVFAPRSSGTGESLYVVDRGIDNDPSPNENDGMMFEYGIPGPTPTNQPPVVNAGPDVSTAGTSPVQLVGTVTDDGLVAPLTIQWSKLSGPGTATFTAPTQAVTNASFSAAGTYTCQLSAFDGEFTRTDTVVVTVTSAPPVNQPPVVNAGPDVTTPLSAAASLAGTVTDDGLPGGPLTIQWSKLSGPGTATFTTPSQATTDVTFSVAGSYTCQLSANDGAFTRTDTCVVTVTSAPVNQPPVVNAGPDVSIAMPSAAHLVGTVTDDGLSGPLTIVWTKLTGPGSATFAPSNAAVADVTFSLAGSYTLQLSANDGQFTVNDTVAVTVQAAPPPSGTVERTIATSEDDAEESSSGSVNRTSSDLELVVDGSTLQVVGIRFQNLTIPAGSYITSAYVQFATDEVWSGATQLTIAGEANDNPPTFTATALNISSRPRTTTTVAWAPVPWTILDEAGPNQRTPNLAGIVQQVVSRPGWASGNALVFVITGTGTRTAVAFDRTPTLAAKLTVNYQSTPPTNQPPVVNAGPDVTGPISPATHVVGTVTDDGLPGAVTIAWTKVSGPGTVTFAPSNAAVTDVTFSAVGSYTLQLSASDGEYTVTDTVVVTVQAVNQQPVVNAGPDVTSPISPATHLVGSVTDDGLPGPVTIQWTKVSGPGTVTFAPSNAAVTDVTFSLVGSYTLRLSANDGQYTVTDTVAVTVQAANQPPVVNAGPDVSHAITSATHLAGTVTDDGLPGPVTIAWTKVSGPGTATFAPANAAVTDVTFSLVGSYTLQLSANDGQYTVNDTVVVTVTSAPVNQPPVVNAGPDLSHAITSATHIAGSVTDDGLPGPVTIAWTRVSGPGTATFAPANAAVTDVTFSVIGSYTLQLSANDGQFTVNDTVVVTVTSTPTGGTVERTIAAAGDDAEEQSNSTNLTSSDIELVVDGSNTQVVGLRFLNLTIPPGATISSAFIQFAADEVWSGPTNLTFAGQAADNAPAFTNAALNISSRPRTTATVAWAPVPWTVVNEVGPNEKTPDLASIVQQIVSRPGWASGNAMAFVVTGTGTRTAVAFDTSATLAAKLTVNYQ